MKNSVLPSISTLVIVASALLLTLAACGTLEDIQDRDDVTETPAVFRTATPGGMISVWLVTPTGGPVSLISTSEPASIEGNVIGPAATATAVQGTLVAATQTAAAPVPVQTFQPNECPVLSGRVPEPRPDDFAQFPSAIGTYLSQGGPPAVLESELRIWGAITDRGGVVQANTDLTGDKIPEIIITLYNPFTYNPDSVLNAGRILVYGCDNGGYRLIYATPINGSQALPVLHRVGDMNGDVKAELVYDVQTCTQTSCTREGQILTWNPLTGVFEPLNTLPIIAINGRLGVVDIDSDGILELMVRNTPPGDTASGPRRSTIEYWDWTGAGYIPAESQLDDPLYRVHAMHDADQAFAEGNWTTAIDGYLTVRDSDNLLPWIQPGERETLQAYVSYRLLMTYARRGNARNVQDIAAALAVENPDGTPGTVYRDMGQAFADQYLIDSSNISAACQAALEVASARPEALSFLNSYGYANRTYGLTDLCPF